MPSTLVTRRHVAVALTALLLSILLADLVVRIVKPPLASGPLQHRVPHQVLGWALEPGAEFEYQADQSVVSVTYSQQGWRDREHPPVKPPNTCRIVLLGDSFMEAYSVGLHQGLAAQLETLAAAENMKVEVINLGVGGYGTLQAYLAYEQEGRRYAADCVLLGFYVSNDVRNNSLELESMLNRDTEKVLSRPFLDDASLPSWNIQEPDFAGATRRFRIGKRIAGLQRYSILASHILAKLYALPSGALESDPGALSLALMGVHFCEEQGVYTKAWTLTETILERLAEAVDRDGARLAVFSVPALHETDRHFMAKAVETLSHTNRLCLEDPPGFKRLAGLLENSEIEYIDLLPAFRKAAEQDNETLFYKSDRHWNPAGHRVAAKTLLREMASRNLLQPEPAAADPAQ